MLAALQNRMPQMRKNGAHRAVRAVSGGLVD